MPALLADTNVLSDLLNAPSQWAEWAISSIAEHSDTGLLVINCVIFAELSVQSPDLAACERALQKLGCQMREIPHEALFLAGRAFLTYRRRGGTRTSPLPDFFIGAHAQVAGLPLVTRDAARYKTYFPKLKIIAP